MASTGILAVPLDRPLPGRAGHRRRSGSPDNPARLGREVNPVAATVVNPVDVDAPASANRPVRECKFGHRLVTLPTGSGVKAVCMECVAVVLLDRPPTSRATPDAVFRGSRLIGRYTVAHLIAALERYEAGEEPGRMSESAGDALQLLADHASQIGHGNGMDLRSVNLRALVRWLSKRTGEPVVAYMGQTPDELAESCKRARA